MTNEDFQKNVLDQLKDIKDGQARIEKKLDAVHDQTALLTEFRTEAYGKFENH